LAATLGYVVVAVGDRAPAMFILVFIIMLGEPVMGGIMASALLLTVAISAVSSTQTTSLPTARGTESMI
jgi:hypothetical protein